LLLAGCGDTLNVNRVPFTPPAVDQLEVTPAKWVIINKDNIDVVCAELKSQGKPCVFMALDEDQYKVHLDNNAKVLTHVSQQNARAKAYDDYYKDRSDK
jgi:hypothetical protein